MLENNGCTLHDHEDLERIPEMTPENPSDKYFRDNQSREYLMLPPWQSEFPRPEADLEASIPANVI